MLFLGVQRGTEVYFILYKIGLFIMFIYNRWDGMAAGLNARWLVKWLVSLLDGELELDCAGWEQVMLGAI